MFHFCTYFDQRYLIRGLAMIQSLAAHCPASKVWVLCMDEETYRILLRLNLSVVQAISLREFEQANQDLLAIKQKRSTLEYYFTCTPSLPRFVLDHYPEVGLITYLDADLFFFADPTPLFGEIGEGSIALVRQRVTTHYPDAVEKYGIYDVSWVTFRRDATGLACLRWWRERCIEWCYNRVADGKYGDQKYLDDWPARFSRVVVLSHKGADLARWNVTNYHLAESGGKQVFVDEQPLIFFHFSGLTQTKRWLYNPRFGKEVKATAILRKGVYGQYLKAITRADRLVNTAVTTTPLDNNVWREMRQMEMARAPGRSLTTRLRGLLSLGKSIANGRLLVCILGRVF